MSARFPRLLQRNPLRFTAAGLVVLSAAVLLGPAEAARADPLTINLGTTANFSVLATDAFTTSGLSLFPMGVGISPGYALTRDGNETFVVPPDVDNAAAHQAHLDAVAAYNQVKSLTPSGVLDGDLGGRTITPGIYYANAALGMTSSITLDAQNNPNAYFIFQINAALDTTANSRVLLVNGAQEDHVFWQMTAAATLGAASTFIGTVLSNAAITVGAGTFVTGRLLTIDGAVTAPAIRMRGDFSDPRADTITTVQGASGSVNVLTNDWPGSEEKEVPAFSRVKNGDYPHLVGTAVGPTPAPPSYGSVTCSDSGTTRGLCTYTPIAGFVGTDGFDYSISRRDLHWNVHVEVIVAAVNHAPVARADEVVATTGGSTVHFSPLDNDSDPDDDKLVIQSVGPVPAAQGLISCSQRNCVFSPAPTYTGIVTVPYTIADRSPAFATSIITVFVDPAPITAARFFSLVHITPAAPIGEWNAKVDDLEAVASCVTGRPSTALSWTAVVDATSFLVQRSPAGADTWFDIATLPATTLVFTDDLVGEGASFQWRVRPDIQRWTGSTPDHPLSVQQSPVATAAGC